ncbi:unnamed protein product [Sphagnum balticum]
MDRLISVTTTRKTPFPEASHLGRRGRRRFAGGWTHQMRRAYRMDGPMWGSPSFVSSTPLAFVSFTAAQYDIQAHQWRHKEGFTVVFPSACGTSASCERCSVGSS